MNLDSHDFAICRANYSSSLTGLIAQFGEPDEKTEDFGTETQVAGATFTFNDGSAIKPLLLGCIVQISYELTPKKKNRLACEPNLAPKRECPLFA